MRCYMSLLSLSLLVALSVGACGRNSASSGTEVPLDSFPEAVRPVVKAVRGNDSAAFADYVSYPLLRPYPLHDIVDASQMRRYYSTLVDDTLRQAIASSTPRQWEEYGWRGWSLGDGRYLWIDDGIYDINYLSASEKQMLDSLVTREMASLLPGLRQGWTPVACMFAADSSAVYRIDVSQASGVDASPVYRLAAFSYPLAPQQKPLSVMKGYQQVEGTASITSYQFSAPDGTAAFYLADVPDDSMSEIEFTSPSGSESSVTVTPAYWLDLLP